MFHNIRTRFLAGGLDYGGSHEPFGAKLKGNPSFLFLFFNYFFKKLWVLKYSLACPEMGAQ